MALRELLSSLQREALEAVPIDRAGLIEHLTLQAFDTLWSCSASGSSPTLFFMAFCSLATFI